MSISSRALETTDRVRWGVMVWAFALRRGMVWAFASFFILIGLLSITQISARDASFALVHLRATYNVNAGQADASVTITDEWGRKHVRSAFEIVTHRGVSHIAKETRSHLTRFALYSAFASIIAFFFGFLTVLKAVRR